MTNETQPERIINFGDSGQYFFLSFLQGVVEELRQKAVFSSMGVGTISKTDRFAYEILHKHGYFESTSQPNLKQNE